jgi:hypothetical protein
MVKPTFCGQTRKVGNVPEGDSQHALIELNAPAENPIYHSSIKH